ncbi:MAG: bifunctional nuclease family protein [Chitinispirillaceae bacterium]|nr:bifunctional nuclease family protein [Chitinispirillaceae bacterium]
MLIKLEFVAFAVDPEKNTPVVMLKETGGVRMLPVAVGPLEAGAIAVETIRAKVQKPLTIDVAKSILEQFGGTLSRVVFQWDAVRHLDARCEISGPDKVRIVVCRPSDALALALRCNAPLYVHDEVLEQYSGITDGSEQEKLRDHVASLDTLAFGSFHLE